METRNPRSVVILRVPNHDGSVGEYKVKMHKSMEQHLRKVAEVDVVLSFFPDTVSLFGVKNGLDVFSYWDPSVLEWTTKVIVFQDLTERDK